MLLIDDRSHIIWVALLKSKAEAFEAFKKFKNLSEAKKNVKLKCLRTDRGGEFNSFEFAKFCEDNGIRRHLMAPYSPQ